MSPLTRNARTLGPALLVFAAAWALAASCLCGAHRDDGELLVLVRDDGGEPLAEVPVQAAGQRLGVTDEHGRLRVRGAHASIAVACPEAYRPVPPKSVKDRGRGTHTFVCRPRLRTIALVVHAPGAHGLVVRADEQSLGRVDERGLLHAVLRRAPGTRVALLLAERGKEPVARRTMVVEDRDGVVLFEP